MPWPGRGSKPSPGWNPASITCVMGKSGRFSKEIAALNRPRGQSGEAVKREQNYFQSQAGRMNYREIADRGWPIGSGAVESACRQSQRRFKGPGSVDARGSHVHVASMKICLILCGLLLLQVVYAQVASSIFNIPLRDIEGKASSLEPYEGERALHCQRGVEVRLYPPIRWAGGLCDERVQGQRLLSAWFPL